MSKKKPSPSQTNRYREIALDLEKERGSSGDLLRLRVTSRSMVPLLTPGDHVLIRSVPPDSFRVGDLIVVRRGAELVTHRLLRVQGSGWIIKGDNLPGIDPPVSPEEVFGKVIALERDGKRQSIQGGNWGKINGWMARLSRLENTWFQSVQKTKRLTPGNRPLANANIVVRLSKGLFRVSRWLLLRFLALI